MEGSVFTPSLEGMKHIKSPEGEMLTKPFLDVCKLILPVLGLFVFIIPSELLSFVDSVSRGWKRNTKLIPLSTITCTVW
ncbi:hypothetical protein Gohar_008327 [Gossypium harknessii]|uniref:Uncharacterized protein n=1 Tax=Gossypium harknessii TaxID=34285 RepID=A0A7J9GKK4_9ROSI|nr:hypothetical protein [Gossypium harknessii]